MPGRCPLIPVIALLSLMSLQLAAQEVVFRHDGQLGKDGKQSLAVPVKEGQILVFRVASLDFAPQVSLTVNGGQVSFGAVSSGVAEQYVRIKRAGTVQLTLAGGTGAGPSFQVRVIKIPDNPPLGRSGVVKGNISSRDPLDQNHQRIDWYPLTVSKGQRILIAMSSKAAGSRLQVEFPDGRTLQNQAYWGNDAGISLDVADSGTLWVGASLDIAAASGNFSLPYALFVRDLPLSGRALNLSANPVQVPFVLVAAGLPFLPETYAFTAPRAGVYQFSLYGRDGQACQLRLRPQPNRELVVGGFREGAGPAVANCYLRANQSMELNAEAYAGDAKSGFFMAVSQTGSGVVVRDNDRFDQELKPQNSVFFVYRGKVGEYVEFQMASDDFRTRLSASDELGQTLNWSNYYGSDFSHAALGGYYFEQAQELVLEARGFDARDEGKFQLQVRSSAGGGLEAPRDWSQAQNLGDKAVFSRLTSHDPVFEGHFGNEYLVDLKAGELIRLAMKSHDFDCSLRLVAPDGQTVFENDDFEGSDSMLECIAPKTGRYSVRAMSWIEEGTWLNASYSLQLKRLGQANLLAGDPSARTGTILANSPLNDDGRPYGELLEGFRTGQRVYIMASSPDFTPRLQLLAADGTVLDDNSGYGQGSDARIDYQLRSNASYRIRVIAGGDGSSDSKGNWTITMWEIK